jgi:hypothetical protein
MGRIGGMAAQKSPPKTIPYSHEAVAILSDAGHDQADIARITGVNRSSICRLLRRIKEDKTQLSQFTAQLEDVMANNISMASETIARSFGWYNGLNESQFSVLPWSAKKGFLDAANNIMGTSFDKRQLLLGRATQNIGVNEVRSLSRDDLKALADVVLVERQGRLFEPVSPTKITDNDPNNPTDSDK